MNKNKQYVIDSLIEKTKYNETECLKICNILDEHFIIGKNNKIKIMNDFEEQLNISKEDADQLYNDCISVIIGGIFK